MRDDVDPFALDFELGVKRDGSTGCGGRGSRGGPVPTSFFKDGRSGNVGFKCL